MLPSVESWERYPLVPAAAGWSGVLLTGLWDEGGSARVKSASPGCGVKDRTDYLLTEF